MTSKTDKPRSKHGWLYHSFLKGSVKENPGDFCIQALCFRFLKGQSNLRAVIVKSECFLNESGST